MVVVEVLADGIADGPAPRVVAEGVGVLVLGKMDGLGKSLREIGEGAGGAGLNVAARTTAGKRRPRAALRSQAERYWPEKK